MPDTLPVFMPDIPLAFMLDTTLVIMLETMLVFMLDWGTDNCGIIIVLARLLRQLFTELQAFAPMVLEGVDAGRRGIIILLARLLGQLLALL